MRIEKNSTHEFSHRLVAVLLHFRTPAMTLRCVSSLFTEGVKEVVLLDNSEDGGVSLAAVRSGLESIMAAGLKVHFLDFGRNLGFAAGVNRCVDHAMKFGAARILLVNSDAWMLSGAVAGLDVAINSGVDVAFPTVLASGCEEKDLFYQSYLALMFPGRIFGSFRVVNGVCMLLSEKYVLPTLLDEEFFFYGEDVDFGCRLIKNGVKIRKVSSAVVAHEKSLSAKNGSLFYEYHVARGHVLLAKKLSNGLFEYVLALWGRCLTLPARAVVRSVRAKNLIPLHALLMVVADLVRGRVRSLTPVAEVACYVAVD